MHVQDDIYTGPTGPNGSTFGFSTNGQIGGSGLSPAQWPIDGNPTMQYGVGPLGRVTFLNIIPNAIASANLAALQASTAGVPLTLTVGAGILGTSPAPDLSGGTVYVLDSNRCISLTSLSNLSGVNFLVTGYDVYGRRQTQLVTGPNGNTVNTKKAFMAILSVVPQSTSALTVSVGVADIFGLPWRAVDAGYIISAKWANVLAPNAGTFTAGDLTSPATNLTGDPRGTFAPAGAASNGVNRLLICQHVDGTACGTNGTPVGAVGVSPA